VCADRADSAGAQWRRSFQACGASGLDQPALRRAVRQSFDDVFIKAVLPAVPGAHCVLLTVLFWAVGQGLQITSISASCLKMEGFYFSNSSRE